MNLPQIDTKAAAAGASQPALKAWLRALELTAPIATQQSRILPTVIEELAETFGEAPALLSDRERLSHRALAQRSNRYARWALAQGLAKGDTVALLMPNRPEYMAIWLGVTRIGGVVALLNTHLAGASLAHCIDIVEPKHVIVAAELVDALAAAQPHLSSNAKVWAHGDARHEFPRIDHDAEQYPDEMLSDAERRPVTIEDRALYIYTSGTTGWPKAANVSHYRLMMWSYWFAGMMDAQPGDRMYNCLPLYHSIGGVVATGSVLVNGGSVVIREKFSARDFWDDVIRWDCTLFQYIGELCRYLVKSEAQPQETAHRIRLACGNGLSGDIWNDFKNRFRIPRILEFYAATEGNVSLFNAEGKPGAIGRIPSFLVHRFPAALVKLDIDKGEPVRNAGGFCTRCGAGEVGEAIGRIAAESNLGNRFEGYTDEAASEKKILHNAFEKGDAWFRTGDLMRKDAQGYFYFVDRIGDTFRWKGENVATSEVSAVITEFAGIVDANVYGVAIPATDGRAGMAALVVDDTFDLAAFRAHLVSRLPHYARPLFLVISSEIELTGTFKHTKRELAHRAYDPSATSDVIYFNDVERQAFVRLDQTLYDRIQSGEVRL